MSFNLGVFPFRLLFQCRYSGTSVEGLVVDVNTVPPPPPVAALGILRVELRLANGQCFAKGCVEGSFFFVLFFFILSCPFKTGLALNACCLICTEDQAYSSYYGDSEYPVTKVLRESVYVEVRILERTDPNVVLTLGRCWATSSPDPQSLPQWDLLVNG